MRTDLVTTPRLAAAPPPRRRRPWLALLAVLAVIAAVCIGLWWRHAAAATPTPARSRGAGALPVSAALAVERDVRVRVRAIGSFVAANTALVRPQVGGTLTALHFKEGQQVRAGELLAQIDARSFAAALAQAQGMLARDVAQLENARIDLARYQGLVQQDAAPKQQADTQAALVRQLEGTVQADRAAADSARLQLAWTKVLAPIAGRAGLKQADLGNVVSPSDTTGIVTITQTRPIALVFAVPAQHLPSIQAHLRERRALPVEAWDRAGQQRLAVGEIQTADNAIDATTDTIKVKALFANDDDALFPNQAVNVVLQLDTQAGAVTVPQAALQRGAQGAFVYVVQGDGTVATRPVQTGASDDGVVAVRGAVHAGDRVVTDGTDRLRDGAAVEVIDPAAAPASAASAPRRGHKRP